MALAGLAGLDRELPRLPAYVAHAKVVAEALKDAFRAAGVPWFRVHPDVPHTHQFQVWLPYPPEALTAAGVRLAEETGTWVFNRWDAAPVPGLAVTEVSVAASALAWTPAAVRDAVGALLERLDRPDGGGGGAPVG
ncbi:MULTISPECIES: hypothetical protein [Streptomyces]|uniref:Uncharacterized protein n=1 Tax=Streptomyces abikoensis TaxID=97398 RepID=A0ABW7TG33_9ACTN